MTTRSRCSFGFYNPNYVEAWGVCGCGGVARAFLAAAASPAACPVWGEDDTRRVLPRAQIDVEFQNPLYTAEIAELWQR